MSGKIKYIYQKNQGLAGARNTGIRAAKGEYVAFLDADDIFLPTKIEEQVRILELNHDFGVCYSNLLHFSDTEPRRYFHHRYRYPSGDIFEPLLHKQFINPLTVMIRRQILERYGLFDESLRRSEDWDLWLRWARAGVKFYYLDKILARYRIRSAENLSSLKSEPQMKEKNLEIFNRLGKKLSNAEWRAYNFPKILRGLKLKCAIAYLMVGDKRSALRFADVMPFGIKTLVEVLSARFWRWFWGIVRRLKHRWLLKKTELE